MIATVRDIQAFRDWAARMASRARFRAESQCQRVARTTPGVDYLCIGPTPAVEDETKTKSYRTIIKW